MVEGVKHPVWASVDGCPIEFKPISLRHAPKFYPFYAVSRPEEDHLIQGTHFNFFFTNYSIRSTHSRQIIATKRGLERVVLRPALTRPGLEHYRIALD